MDENDEEIDVQVVANFLSAAKYNEEDWQNLIRKVSAGSGMSLEKTRLVLETLHDYMLELAQVN